MDNKNTTMGLCMDCAPPSGGFMTDTILCKEMVWERTQFLDNTELVGTAKRFTELLMTISLEKSGFEALGTCDGCGRIMGIFEVTGDSTKLKLTMSPTDFCFPRSLVFKRSLRFMMVNIHPIAAIDQ